MIAWGIPRGITIILSLLLEAFIASFPGLTYLQFFTAYSMQKCFCILVQLIKIWRVWNTASLLSLRACMWCTVEKNFLPWGYHAFLDPGCFSGICRIEDGHIEDYGYGFISQVLIFTLFRHFGTLPHFVTHCGIRHSGTNSARWSCSLL